ncbi:Arginyl-tRNA--protein transferase 1 [Favolaschia claudopus]|uniref:Arginyl-tRNA--protein transferase 1 n=1 Tax=Favolaschia claudopus TaxID=2862362 RepID=A0AAW0EDJ9_9AGAR
MAGISVGSPHGPSRSTCGYCSPPGARSPTKSSAQLAGISAIQLSCQIYQQMIDRGWRRSGSYCYKPDLKASCCPYYTIKLDALNYKPSKSKRKLVNRWNQFMVPEDRSKAKDLPFSLSTAIHAAESDFCTTESPRHRFEIILEPASYSPEKFQLYCKYQKDIHKEAEAENTPQRFKRFLVDSPLLPSRIPYPYSSPPSAHLPENYGSYHQLYKCDDKLIAVSVIDILPNCVSSVYFMYDSEWEDFSLGKLSALREISLAYEMHAAGAPGMAWLYLGYYIHSCPKMRYKGDYSPSYLADPETYEWYPLEDCVPLLEQNRYACFSNPHHSTTEFPDPSTVVDLPVLDDEALISVHVVDSVEGNKLITSPVITSSCWEDEEIRQDIVSCIAALGIKIAEKIIFYVDD